MDKKAKEIKFNVGNNNSGEYKVKAIQDNKVYTKKSKGHLLRLYYLISWKEYPEQESIWEPASAV